MVTKVIRLNLTKVKSFLPSSIKKSGSDVHSTKHNIETMACYFDIFSVFTILAFSYKEGKSNTVEDLLLFNRK